MHSDPFVDNLAHNLHRVEQLIREETFRVLKPYELTSGKSLLSRSNGGRVNHPDLQGRDPAGHQPGGEPCKRPFAQVHPAYGYLLP